MTKQIYKFDPDHVRFILFVFYKNIFAAFLFFSKNTAILTASSATRGAFQTNWAMFRSESTYLLTQEKYLKSNHTFTINKDSI